MRSSRRAFLSGALITCAAMLGGCTLSESQATSFDTEFTDAALISLTVTPGTIDPVFSPSVTAYDVLVPNNIASVFLTARARVSSARMAVNGVFFAPDMQTDAIPLVVGFNTITVRVTAGDELTTKTYTITVERAPKP